MPLNVGLAAAVDLTTAVALLSLPALAALSCCEPTVLAPGFRCLAKGLSKVVIAAVVLWVARFGESIFVGLRYVIDEYTDESDLYILYALVCILLEERG